MIDRTKPYFVFRDRFNSRYIDTADPMADYHPKSCIDCGKSGPPFIVTLTPSIGLVDDGFVGYLGCYCIVCFPRMARWVRRGFKEMAQ